MTEREMSRFVDDLNGRCEMHMKQVHDMFTDLKHAVFGNGTEGLKTRMTKMEMTIADIAEGRKEARRLFYGAAVSLVLMVIAAVAGQFFAYERAQTLAEQTQHTVAQQQTDLEEIKESLAAIEVSQ